MDTKIKSCLLTILLTSINCSATAINNSGTIHFNGKVVDGTCNITFKSNGSGNSNNGTVDLKTMTTNDLFSQPVNFSLTPNKNCASTFTSSKAKINWTGSDLNSQGLKNIAKNDAAKHIYIQLTPINSQTNTPITSGHRISLFKPSKNNNISYNYTVQMKADGKATVTPGMVQSNATYTVVYN
ncbi:MULTISPECIES: fimbrial protein [unclassified Photobacterium]|uniref:fimbrial protein n=1 Tax=unclassified Photobacterium TaxID=2628852 RepID=UPI001EDDEDD8|nr:MULTISPECIES: fimbrial protein [unclassified Photobacterium]MCG3862987.1 type 1 fimbrial protein [Photobacterium sp. Ph6]MCG3874518.1 type 1 fimbrial protein [Photobacterium sp. Ph5]